MNAEEKMDLIKKALSGDASALEKYHILKTKVAWDFQPPRPHIVLLFDKKTKTIVAEAFAYSDGRISLVRGRS